MESPPPEPSPAEAPASATTPARPPIRPVSVVATVTVSAVVLATGVALAVADDQGVEQLGGLAASYVPRDGHVEWVQDDLGTVRMSESARSIGYEDILLLPGQASAAVASQLSDDARVAQFWRESALTISGGGPDQAGTQTTDLHRLSAEGLSLLAGYGGSIGFVYSPPLLELPADVAPGSTWSSAGDALPGGVLTYTARYTASAPADPELIAVSGLSGDELSGCLQSDGGSVYRDDDGELLLDIVETDLWCEGRGRVAIVATVNGEPVVQGPMSDPPGAFEPDATASPPQWGGAGGWRAAEAANVNLDAFFGEQQLAVALVSSPRRTDSGLVVAVNTTGDDLLALRLDGGALVRQWFAHPGGEIVAIGTTGEVTVVTTSERRILAYSGTGRRLWTAESAELILAPPTDAGDGTVVLVGLDGTVLSFDRLTGDLVWERRLAADVSLPATAAGGSVVVVDRAGAITAFDRATGETRWTGDSENAPAGVAGAGGAILVAGEDGFVRAYDAMNGARGWALRYVGALGAVIDLGASALLVTNETTVSVGIATGVVQWAGTGAHDAVSDGVRTVLLGEDVARLVDASGSVLAEWEIPSHALSIYRYAVAGADGFWVFRSNQPAFAVGRP